MTELNNVMSVNGFSFCSEDGYYFVKKDNVVVYVSSSIKSAYTEFKNLIFQKTKTFFV